ncbi:MAG: ATP-binding protein [bacterium]|nr:ATP-binding protein [bacterium]
MPIGSFVSVLTILISLTLSLLILIKNPKSPVNLSFGAFTLCIVTWVLTNFLADQSSTPETALFWARATVLGPVVLSPILLFFSDVYPKPPTVIKPLVWVIATIPTLILLPFIPTALNISKVTFTNAGQQTEVGPVYSAIVLFIAIYALISLAKLYTKYRRSYGLQKIQLAYLLGGLFATLLFALVMSGVLPLFGFSQLISIAPASTLILTTAVTYSIIRHRLLDIEIIIRRSLVYSSLLFVLAIIYSSLVFVLNRLFLPEGTSSFPRITDLLAIIVVAFTGDPLKRFIEKTTDKIFFKARYNAEETISNLAEDISSIIDLGELLLAIKNNLAGSVKMSKFAVYLRTDGHFEKIEVADGFDNTLDTIAEQKYFLSEILEKFPRLLVMEEIKSMIQERRGVFDEKTLAAFEALEKSGVAVIVPLISKDKITGAVFLGEKLSGDLYSNEDLKLLEILGRQAAIAIENAKLYDEQKKFASKLQIEVSKATEDLRAANDRLKELDKAKDEFVSVVSHELRTPMTAIKSYVWLVLNGRAGPLNTQMQNYLFKVYDSSERLIGMINDVLDVSHIETGRLNIELEPVSLIKVAQDVTDTLAEQARELKIETVIDKDSTVPLVSADIQKLNEIFTNLIGNALKFTRAGGKITVSFQKNAGNIETSVADTGIGIRKDDLPKLFSKFGRLQKSYATMATSGGSGLGLYITKNYIELMHGKIWANSVEGKGTTFTFSLPISKSQKPVEHDPSTLMLQGMLKKR